MISVLFRSCFTSVLPLFALACASAPSRGANEAIQPVAFGAGDCDGVAGGLRIGGAVRARVSQDSSAGTASTRFAIRVEQGDGRVGVSPARSRVRVSWGSRHVDLKACERTVAFGQEAETVFGAGAQCNEAVVLPTGSPFVVSVSNGASEFKCGMSIPVLQERESFATYVDPSVTWSSAHDEGVTAYVSTIGVGRHEHATIYEGRDVGFARVPATREAPKGRSFDVELGRLQRLSRDFGVVAVSVAMNVTQETTRMKSALRLAASDVRGR